MIHGLIVGVTQSGKTTLAHALAQAFAARRHNVIVFDPLGTPTASGGWPESAIVFHDKDKFLEYLNRPDVSHAHIFIDEAYEIFSHADPSNNWLLTRGRHFGFQIFPIAQRPKMLPPSVRSQCGVCYMFRLSKDDARELAADFGHNYPEILETTVSDEKVILPLDKGDYLTLNSGSAEFSRANIFSQLSKGKK